MILPPARHVNIYFSFREVIEFGGATLSPEPAERPLDRDCFELAGRLKAFNASRAELDQLGCDSVQDLAVHCREIRTNLIVLGLAKGLSNQGAAGLLAVHA